MSDTKVNIAVAQMDCVVGETEPNLNKIRHFTELAAKLGAELVIFPECATTGYFVGDKMDKLAEAQVLGGEATNASQPADGLTPGEQNSGKIWTAPTLVGSRLYVRDAQEIAAFELDAH